MKVAFFISSNDTNLALKTIHALRKRNQKKMEMNLLGITLTPIVEAQVKDLKCELDEIISLLDILKIKDFLPVENLTNQHLTFVQSYIKCNQIEYIYIGDSSADNQLFLSIVENFHGPILIANESMQKPESQFLKEYKSAFSATSNIKSPSPFFSPPSQVSALQSKLQLDEIATAEQYATIILRY